MGDDTTHEPVTRRRLLGALGAGVSIPLLGGELHDWAVEAAADADGDGIPDRVKRSARAARRIDRTFEGGFDGFELGRHDLLLDARYVGDVSIPLAVKRGLERRFRENGIYLQWLDHGREYDRGGFESRYGNSARRILWARDSFYHREIEDFLKDLALQLVVVPGAPDGPFRGRIYSTWANTVGSHPQGYVNGMSFGNRAVVAERHDRWEQTRLIFHEIAHLGLCHSDDPENRGVMGTNETLSLTDEEWSTLADNLSNVRDGTGYDLLFRPCLWLGR